MCMCSLTMFYVTNVCPLAAMRSMTQGRSHHLGGSLSPQVCSGHLSVFWVATLARLVTAMYSARLSACHASQWQRHQVTLAIWQASHQRSPPSYCQHAHQSINIRYLKTGSYSRITVLLQYCNIHDSQVLMSGQRMTAAALMALSLQQSTTCDLAMLTTNFQDVHPTKQALPHGQRAVRATNPAAGWMKGHCCPAATPAGCCIQLAVAGQPGMLMCLHHTGACLHQDNHHLELAVAAVLVL